MAAGSLPAFFEPEVIVQPDVSVLTPSFGYGRYIRDCIDSVQAQDGITVQHVVNDGGSEDDTIEILRRYDQRVDWVSEPDEGQSDALNQALGRATGRWIAWLNADEFYLPGGLRSLLERGDRCDVDVVYGDSVFVDEEGRLRRLAPQHRFSRKVLAEYGCYISSCSVLIRREVLQDGAWDPTARRRMDWDLYMRLARDGARFHHSPYPVGAFREHDERVTASSWDEWIDEDSRLSERHGMAADPYQRWRASRIGRWLHPALKALDGAYLRQIRARRLAGADLRWFRGPQQAAACRRLVTRSYGLRPPL